MDGDGSESNPYIIRDDHELQSVTEQLDANYKLGRDINASKTVQWYNGDGFEPLGNDSTAFTGSLNGSGYIIEGISINRPSTSFIGLFGKTNSSNISNVGIENIDVTGQSEVGGLVGNSINSDINNSYSQGMLFGEGSFRAGGLVGYNKDNSNISYSYSNTKVQSDGNNVGGLAGKNENSTIIKSYSIGDVNGSNNNLGGLVGANIIGGEITQSYAQGNITGSDNIYVGGVVGYNKEGTIDRVYGTGTINSGGIIGELIGSNKDTLIDSYWDTESTNQFSGIGNDTGNTTNINGLITNKMQGSNAESNMDAFFDFTNTWTTITEDYPEHQA